MLQFIMKGKIEGSRGIGRTQMSSLKNISYWTGIRSAEQLFRVTENLEQLYNEQQIIMYPSTTAFSKTALEGGLCGVTHG